MTIAKLAEKIVAQALTEGKSLEVMIDAFKAVLPYHALLLKQKRSSDDESDEPSFHDFTATIQEAQNGGTKKGLRDRPG